MSGFDRGFIECKINDQLVDLSPKDIIAISYAVSDIVKIGVLSNVFTKTIRLPFTKRNKIVMKNAELIPVLNDDIRQSVLTAEILIDGINVIEGIGKYIESEITSRTGGYKIQIVGSHVNWSSLMQGRTLCDIAQPVIVLDFLTVTNSWTHNGDDDEYVFALCRIGEFFNRRFSKTWNIKQMRPKLFTKPMMIKIFASYGFATIFKGTFTNSQEFRDENMSLGNTEFLGTEALLNGCIGQKNEADALDRIDENVVFSPADPFNNPWPLKILYTKNWNTGLTITQNDCSMFTSNANNATFVAPVTATYNFVISVSIRFGNACTFDHPAVTTSFSVGLVEGQLFAPLVVLKHGQGQDHTAAGPHFNHSDWVEVFIENNLEATLFDPAEPDYTAITTVNNRTFTNICDDLVSDMDYTDGGAQTWEGSRAFLRSVSFMRVTISDAETREEFNTFDICRYVKRFRQLPFLKSIQQQFNLFYVTDVRKKTVTVVQRDEFYGSPLDADDITKKVDTKLKRKIVDLDKRANNRLLTFEYVDDDSDTSIGKEESETGVVYAKKEFELDNENLEGENNVTSDIIFAACIMECSYCFWARRTA